MEIIVGKVIAATIPIMPRVIRTSAKVKAQRRILFEVNTYVTPFARENVHLRLGCERVCFVEASYFSIFLSCEKQAQPTFSGGGAQLLTLFHNKTPLITFNYT